VTFPFDISYQFDEDRYNALTDPDHFMRESWSLYARTDEDDALD